MPEDLAPLAAWHERGVKAFVADFKKSGRYQAEVS
jgi:hypothetical protein